LQIELNPAKDVVMTMTGSNFDEHTELVSEVNLYNHNWVTVFVSDTEISTVIRPANTVGLVGPCEVTARNGGSVANQVLTFEWIAPCREPRRALAHLRSPTRTSPAC